MRRANVSTKSLQTSLFARRCSLSRGKIFRTP
nr:MAG TPA: hypothetical protein [Bacteriophage sp.]